MRRQLLWTAVAALVLSGCDDLDNLGTQPEAHRWSGERSRAGSRPIRVLTRNVFIGTDVDAVLNAGAPEEIPALVAQAFEGLFATDFRERAVSLAREIALTRPHLVGLQEISTIRLQSPGDAIAGGTVPAEDVVFDYLAILLNALESMGSEYRVVTSIQNADVEVPMLSGVSPLTFDDVRLTDFDVILSRSDVTTSDPVARNYAARLTVPIGPIALEIPRGFTAVTAQIGGVTVRFANTHLEAGDHPAIVPLRAAQADELIRELQDATVPVIVVGDLNSRAPDGPAYQMFLAAGFQDAWTLSRRRSRHDGFTCCHALNLRNTIVAFDRRIDFVLARGAGERSIVRAPRVRVIGDNERRLRTPSGLWPSDHAGVFARLSFRRPWVSDPD